MPVTIVKILCAPNVQNMASDPDLNCGGGKSRVCETAISRNLQDLLISCILQIFQFYQVLRRFCEGFAKVSKLWKTRESWNTQIIREISEIVK